MATCIHPSLSCLPPFYTIPIFPLLNRKIYSFFWMHTAFILYSEEYIDIELLMYLSIQVSECSSISIYSSEYKINAVCIQKKE